jgi:hypothetical protein
VKVLQRRREEFFSEFAGLDAADGQQARQPEREVGFKRQAADLLGIGVSKDPTHKYSGQ